jgi:hypothetical protein
MILALLGKSLPRLRVPLCNFGKRPKKFMTSNDPDTYSFKKAAIWSEWNINGLFREPEAPARRDATGLFESVAGSLPWH